jgi:branched-chain amino acid transport system substrate-binding protein
MGRLFAIITGAMVLLSAGRAPAGVVKVGLLADFTGAFATWGPQFREGVEAYQALRGNSVQGPDEPHEIQFIYRDTASQGPEKARQLAQELVLHDHAKFLCGLDLSPHAMALADISKEAKVPVVIMNAATSSITRMSPYFVRVSQTVPQDVAPLGPGLWRTASSGSTQSSATMPPATTPKRISSKRSRKLAGRVSAAPARRSRRPTSRPIWSACWRPSPMRSTCSSRPARRRSPSSGPMLSVG